jgi:hypothetical protein
MPEQVMGSDGQPPLLPLDALLDALLPPLLDAPLDAPLDVLLPPPPLEDAPPVLLLDVALAEPPPEPPPTAVTQLAIPRPVRIRPVAAARWLLIS